MDVGASGPASTTMRSGTSRRWRVNSHISATGSAAVTQRATAPGMRVMTKKNTLPTMVASTLYTTTWRAPRLASSSAHRMTSMALPTPVSRAPST